MKNKLLFCIPSVALAATMPIIASCNKPEPKPSGDTFEYSSETIKDYQWVDPIGGRMSESNVTSAYLNAIKDNNKILADDIAWDVIFPISETNDEDLETLSLKVGEINTEESRISFSFDYKSTATPTNNLFYEMVDIPITIKYGEGVWRMFHWTISSSFTQPTDLKNDSKWSLTVQKFGETDPTKYNNQSSDPDLETAFKFLTDYLTYSALYLSLTNKEV